MSLRDICRDFAVGPTALLASLLLAPGVAAAQIDPSDLLPVEQAFALEAEALDHARWNRHGQRCGTALV